MQSKMLRHRQATTTMSPQTPLHRLPLELRAHIYQYIVGPKLLDIRQLVWDHYTECTAPALLLVSRATYADVRDYLFHDCTFTIQLYRNQSSQRVRFYGRREGRQNILRRLKALETVVSSARHLRFSTEPVKNRFRGVESVDAAVELIGLWLNTRAVPLDALELFGPEWSCSQPPGEDNAGLPCEILERISRLRCRRIRQSMHTSNSGQEESWQIAGQCTATDLKKPTTKVADAGGYQPAEYTKLLHLYWKDIYFYQQRSTKNRSSLTRFFDCIDEHYYERFCGYCSCNKLGALLLRLRLARENCAGIDLFDHNRLSLRARWRRAWRDGSWWRLSWWG